MPSAIVGPGAVASAIGPADTAKARCGPLAESGARTVADSSDFNSRTDDNSIGHPESGDRPVSPKDTGCARRPQPVRPAAPIGNSIALRSIIKILAGYCAVA